LFDLARNNNIPISGTLTQQKAKQIAEKLKIERFKESKDWVQSFRKWNIIAFSILSGEIADVVKE